jgi:Peptidoglycan-binding protein, CsiV
MRLPIFLTFVLLAAGSAAVPAAAAPQPGSWYAVEVLVFRYTGADAAQGETWPARVPKPATAHAVYPPAVSSGPFAALATASPAMAAAQSRLASAPGYEPVLETGWRQPKTPASRATAVSLAPPGTAPAPETAAGAVQLDGRITVIMANRKPNVSLRLRLCEPPPPGLAIQVPAAASAPASAADAATIAPSTPETFSTAYASGPANPCFALVQRRFVTPGQFEYFDNPAFGALVLVREVSAPE